MPTPDEAIDAFKRITKDFEQFCAAQGSASEADTRVKMIDRVLKEVLLWPERAIRREDHVDRGFIDYTLDIGSRPLVAVEAKREGDSFLLPITANRTSYSLNGSILGDKAVAAAITQVRGYCDDAGIRFAIATNGCAWIVFRAVRDDMPWKKGHAIVFRNTEEIFSRGFTSFWNLLSFEAISAGSLQDAFSSSLRASRSLKRVIDNLFNADLPLRRNRLNHSLQPLIDVIFRDIADQDQLDVLKSCYVHTGTLKNVANDFDDIVTETIPQFLRDEGTVPVGSPDSRSGFERVIHDDVSSRKGSLFLLLGGIGCGKSTFLKRYQRTTGKEVLDASSLWFAIDFLQAPLDPTELEQFAWSNVLKQLRSRYANRDYEKRKHLYEVFDDDIEALRSTILTDVKRGTHRYDQLLTSYLVKWQENLTNYVPNLVKNSCVRDTLSAVMFIDNVDQLSPAYQAQIFLLAQRMTRMIGSITIVALREESYYGASVQKAFTAYSDRKFHIASPHFGRMIQSRIDYAIALMTSEKNRQNAQALRIAEFFRIVQTSVFGNNRNIARFIGALCYGNMRLALQMFTTFLTSGATDVGKMLKIYEREHSYNVAFHEFVKSIMLGERCYYKEDQSPILNIFNVGAERNASHFTAWRILLLLIAHRGESTAEGRGYVELSRVVSEFEDVFDNRDDVMSAMRRLVARQLVETNTRATDSVDGVSHVRVTSGGWYFVRYLAQSFAYLDLVIQDTPFDDHTVEAELRQSVFKIGNLGGKRGDKIDRVRARIKRVYVFLDYLQKQEEAERVTYRLDGIPTEWSRPIVSGVRSQFRSEEQWIDRRLAQNREKYEEEASFATNPDEEAAFGVAQLLDASDTNVTVTGVTTQEIAAASTVMHSILAKPARQRQGVRRRGK